MTEPASVVAARQLAEEARARQSRSECATSAVTTVRKPHPLRTRRASAALLAAVAAVTAGCATGPDTACALVLHSPGLRVVLGDGWPPPVDRVVEVKCEGCDPAMPEGAGTLAARPAADGVAQFGLAAHAPEVTVRVLDQGMVVEALVVEPDYEPLDGDRECPGPSEAEVEVPAP